MATKTTTKSDPTFAAAIARVQPALTAWRQKRKHREPIPEPLWRTMVRLARRYGLSRVAQVLRVNYTALKRHLVATAAPQAPRSGAIAAEFVEVPMSTCPSGSPWVIELEDRKGSKLTLRLAQTDSAGALALAQGLWRQRS
jgi:anti-sigma-K factor RskA